MDVGTALPWIKFLGRAGELNTTDLALLTGWLLGNSTSNIQAHPVKMGQRTKALEYADRKRRELPQLWVNFKTYRRLMTGTITEE